MAQGEVIIVGFTILYVFIGILIVIKDSFFNKCPHCKKNTGVSYTGGSKYTCFECRNCNGVYSK